MKRIKVYTIVCMVLCLFLVLTGCAGGNTGEEDGIDVTTPKRGVKQSEAPEVSDNSTPGDVTEIISNIQNKMNIAPLAELTAKSTTANNPDAIGGWDLKFIKSHEGFEDTAYGYSSAVSSDDDGSGTYIKEDHDEWVIFEFDKEYKISEVWLYPRQDMYMSEGEPYDMYGESFPAVLAIEISNNGEVWDEVYMEDGIKKPEAEIEYSSLADMRGPGLKACFAEVTTKYIKVHALSLLGFERAEEIEDYRLQLYLVEIYAAK